MARVLAGLAGLLVLVGCATAAQKQADAIRAGIQETHQAAAACFNEAAERTRVKERMPKAIDVSAPALDLLSDGSFATEDEIQAVLDSHTAMIPCREIMVRGYQRYAPVAAVAYMESVAETDKAKAAFIERRATWGEANQRLLDINNAFRARLAEIEAAMARDLNAAHYQEAAQRRAAAQGMQQFLYQQQLLNSLNRPQYQPVTQTNCRQFGNTVNCTSW